jgi:hypothetical protein
VPERMPTMEQALRVMLEKNDMATIVNRVAQCVAPETHEQGPSSSRP